MVVLKRFWIQLTADRKKFSAVCALAGVALLLWARLIVISNMPKTAIADEEAPKTEQTEGPITVNKIDHAAQEQVVIKLDDGLSRDPFVIPVLHYPKPQPVLVLSANQAKSQTKPVEDPEQLEARLRAVYQKFVDRMSLDGILSSAGIAVISGGTYQLGDELTVVGNEQVRFRLVEVRNRSVVLDCDGRRFQLKMKAPGG